MRCVLLRLVMIWDSGKLYENGLYCSRGGLGVHTATISTALSFFPSPRGPHQNPSGGSRWPRGPVHRPR